MTKRNPNLAKLPAGYLFPVIAKKRQEYVKNNPGKQVISLGIGDTPGPLPKVLADGLAEAAAAMGTAQGYSGYPDQGLEELQTLISKRFYAGKFKPAEIFISDGAKCDLGRLVQMFGKNNRIAVQDPVYPAYVDACVIAGIGGDYIPEEKKYSDITYLPCTAENGFFPELSAAKDCDLIFFCSPNNPTGATATRDQLQKLVQFATENNAFILYDAAYSLFIQDSELPTSIFDLPGAEKVALEMNSFSKFASFTGVRLGWTVVPEALQFADGQSVRADWVRASNTLYNGTSPIIQSGGIAALSEQGFAACKAMIADFMTNAEQIKSVLQAKGLNVFAGENAPYIWAEIPGKTSWESFDYLLEEAQIVCTPGAGFGNAGEGYVRFSAFGQPDQIAEACRRLEELTF